MSTKALSNGTLSLRFMQNAQRAKQQAQVQVEAAKIDDDAEWHVSKELQDLWRTASSSSQTAPSQEASYLPFLFPESGIHEKERPAPEVGSTSARSLRGRRTFKRGKEVIEERSTSKPDESLPINIASNNTDANHRQGKKLVSISGFKRTPTASTSGTSKKTAKAQALIHEDIDVGSDLKSARRQKTDSSYDPPVSNERSGFVKPAGIDVPPGAVTASVPSKPRPISPDHVSTAGSMTRAESIVQQAKSQSNLRKRKQDEASVDESSAQVLGQSISSIAITALSSEGPEVATPKSNYRKKKKTIAMEA